MIAVSADILHRSLPAVVHQYGTPASVATRDDGQHITFVDDGATLDTIVDDDAVVHAFDLALPRGAHATLDVDGTTHTFTFGTTTSLGARDELAADAETEGADFRVFRRGPDSTLVLVFDRAAATLTHVIVGDRATMLRLGYLRAPQPTQPQFPYIAPHLRRSALADGSGTHATIVRLDLDRAGAVRTIAVIVPSGDDAFDAALSARLAHDAYTAGQLGGRPIGASVFREIRH